MVAMLVFPIIWITLVAWVTVSPVWHPLIAAILSVAGVCLLVMAVRAVILREITFSMATNALPIDNYRWLKGWDAAKYTRHFNSFLQVHGWRVLSASVVGQDRVEFVAEKDRCVIALLCLRPGQPAMEADLGHLDSVRRARKAARAALVTDMKPAPQEMHAASLLDVMRLRFDDLELLSEVFCLGG